MDKQAHTQHRPRPFDMEPMDKDAQTQHPPAPFGVPLPPSRTAPRPTSAHPPSMRVGISACLLGDRVRYDGGHKHNPLLSEGLEGQVQWFPLCPEVGCGLGIPRTPMRLEGDPRHPRLRTRPMAHGTQREDHTLRLHRWCQHAMDALNKEGLDGFLLKSRSPSCGLAGVPIFLTPEAATPDQTHPSGVGIFARMLRATFPHLTMAEGDLLQDAASVHAFFALLHKGTGPSTP